MDFFFFCVAGVVCLAPGVEYLKLRKINSVFAKRDAFFECSSGSELQKLESKFPIYLGEWSIVLVSKLMQVWIDTAHIQTMVEAHFMVSSNLIAAGWRITTFSLKETAEPWLSGSPVMIVLTFNTPVYTQNLCMWSWVTVGCSLTWDAWG